MKKTIVYINEAIDSKVHECPWTLEVIQLVKKFMCQLRLRKGVTMKGKIFYDMTPCRLVEIYRFFGGIFCLHLQDRRGHAVA